MRFKPDLLAGLITGIFSIPAGMAFAKLAGVSPAYGLYAGIIPTLIASLTTGTVLMISTVTSAIAISTHSVIALSGLDAEKALFTLTFLVGIIMLLLGLLRLGEIVHCISHSVMTGFILGVSLLIVIGELGDLVGYPLRGEDKWDQFLDAMRHINLWDLPTLSVGVGAMIFMLAFQRFFKQGAAIVTLVLFSLGVYLLDLTSIKTVGEIASIPSAFPHLVLPDFTLIPQLLVGAFSIAMIALTQGASVNSALGGHADHSRDFIGQGLGNIAGSFFQSMGTGGSLSRTAMSVEAGAVSRWSGIIAALCAALFVIFAGKSVEVVPLTVISGILCVVVWDIVQRKLADVKLVIRSSLVSAVVMTITFLSALFIPLQWTIFLGAGLSLIHFFYLSSTEVHLYQIIQNDQGQFEECPLPPTFPSNQVTIVGWGGGTFFGEVPQIRKQLPSHKQTKNSVIIWRMRGCASAHSTFLKFLKSYARELEESGNRLMIAGAEPHLLAQLKRTHAIEEASIFTSQPTWGASLQEAIESANQWIK